MDELQCDKKGNGWERESTSPRLRKTQGNNSLTGSFINFPTLTWEDYYHPSQWLGEETASPDQHQTSLTHQCDSSWDECYNMKHTQSGQPLIILFPLSHPMERVNHKRGRRSLKLEMLEAEVLGGQGVLKDRIIWWGKWSPQEMLHCNLPTLGYIPFSLTNSPRGEQTIAGNLVSPLRHM
jgi:hypothetical protein